MKKISLVLIIAIICIASGSYAIFLDGSNNDVAASVANPNTIKDVVADDVVDENILADDNVNSISEDIISNDIVSNIVSSAVSDDNEPKIIKLSSRYSVIDGYNRTDRYFPCLGCDGLFPLGEITKKLPDYYKICTGESSLCGSGIIPVDAYETYDEVKCPATDDYYSGKLVHEDAPSEPVKYPLEDFKPIYVEPVDSGIHVGGSCDMP